jgi:hypothetical protein
MDPVPRPPRYAPCNLAVNFLPIKFLGGTFRAGVLVFESAAQLAELRAEHRDTHVIARDGNRLICVPLREDAPEVGAQEKFAVGEVRRLAVALVRHALVRELVDMDYRMWSFKPVTFVSRYRQQDLLAACAGSHRGSLAAAHVFPQFSLDPRVTGPGNLPGILVGLRTRNEIDLTVAELLERGVPVQGRYVSAVSASIPPDPDRDPLAYRRLVGAVEAVRDGRLVLADARDMPEVAASHAWLEGRHETFQDVVKALVGGRAGDLFERLEEARFDLVGGEGRLQRITALANRLAVGGPVPIAPGVSVEIGQPLGTGGETRRTVASSRFDEPTFVFDPAGDKTHRYAQDGLVEFGPFDSQFFTPRRPRIVALTPRAYKGRVEVLVNAFQHGVPGGKVFTQGFARKYRLTDCEVRVEPFDASGPCDAAAYRNACLAALRGADKPDLVIVITSEEQEHLAGDDSPYLVAKSTLMSQGVPVQEIQIETASRRDIASPLDSLALQIYAKLGGIPFVIAAQRAVAHELIIGIGSAQFNISKFGTPERVVGITSVFDSDGNYILTNTSREANYADYPDELLHALRECITEVRSRNAWQPDDTIRLIFHVFKPLKYTEADAVKALVDELLADFHAVEYAFVHVVETHDWFLFDTNADGIGEMKLPSGREIRKGHRMPRRGHAVAISDTEILVTVTGPYDVKRPTHGMPQPMLLKLNTASTFTDIEYLAGQAFRFTAMSWRRFYPSHHPITIQYSDLIAHLLGQLRHVRNWNADILRTNFQKSRWFL